jgi:hypothetical protein
VKWLRVICKEDRQMEWSRQSTGLEPGTRGTAIVRIILPIYLKHILTCRLIKDVNIYCIKLFRIQIVNFKKCYFACFQYFSHVTMTAENYQKRY